MGSNKPPDKGVAAMDKNTLAEWHLRAEIQRHDKQPSMLVGMDDIKVIEALSGKSPEYDLLARLANEFGHSSRRQAIRAIWRASIEK